MMYLGDIALSQILYFGWNSNAVAGGSITRATNGTISVYKADGLTQSTSGITDTEDFDGLTGVHWVKIDTSADGTFYATGNDFNVVLSAATIDGVTINAVLATFSINNRSGLRPTTAGRTLVVDAAGLADANMVKAGPTGSGTTQTARDLGASVLLSSGTGTGQLDFTSGIVKANLAQILGTALTETAGQIAAGFKKVFDVASPVFTATSVNQTGDSYARVGAPAGASVSADVAAVKTDTAAIKTRTDAMPVTIRSGTAQAGTASSITLDASASATDGTYITLLVLITGGTGVGQCRLATSYTGSTKVITVAPSWITNPDATSTFMLLAWGGVDVEMWELSTPNALSSGRVDSRVGAMSANTITSAVIATDAITAAAIATDAIGSAELAASAVTEIQSGLATSASISALNNLSAAQVNAEVVDALNVDTYAEPGQAAPGATVSLATKISYLYKAWRNRTTQTTTEYNLYGDDATTVDQKASFSDNGTTADRGEIATGP